MKNDFDIKKFLIENKLTSNSRLLTENSNPELEENVDPLVISALVGPLGIGAASAGIVKLMDALENGKFGEKGKKIAAALASLGQAANSVKEVEELDEEYLDEEDMVDEVSDEENLDEYDFWGDENIDGEEYNIEGDEDVDLGSPEDFEFSDEEELEENVDPLVISALVGPLGIGAASAGIVKLMDALENGKFGEKGKKIAAALASLGQAANSVKEVEELDEAKKPSAGLTKKEKSKIVKKARAGEDIGKKGKGFEKVAKAAGGGEKNVKKIAGASMWRGEAAKKNKRI